ncbi:uncharacterized protein [Triticum aestivum]|uniref:uncharacterized protein n=1 Tax=Triticum aestivum TaxID=4565 RepID=UPI001D02DD20|nr:uncharacterized protein LOC123125886 [Triticum aestivum]
MADKGKGKADARYKPWQRRRQGAARTETEAVDDTAGTSSRTSGRTETAGDGGTQQELPPGVSYQFSGAPGGGGGSGLSNQARGSAPFGGQNQIANPQFGGGGGGSGAGYGGFSQFAHGHGGFSQMYSRPPAAMLQPTLGNNPAYTGEASTAAAHPTGPVRECTICKTPTAGLWTATTLQGTRVGTPLPLCDACHSKIFSWDRPLQHLHQYLATTVVGRGAGSIHSFLTAIGRAGGWDHGDFALAMRLLPQPPGDQAGGSAPFFGIDVPSGYVFFSGGQNQIASSDGLAPAPAQSAMSPWCVVCNNAAGTLWDWLPICEACYHRARYNREVYRARMQIANASAAQAQARAEAQALKDRAYQAMAQAEPQALALAQQAQAQAQEQALVQKAQAQAQAHGIAIDQQRPLITLYPRHAPRPSGCRYCGYRYCRQPMCETCCRLMKL